jgi:two-component system response regulator MprA
MATQVILVEDEELISTMISFNLEEEGFDVISLRAAEELLARVEANPACCDIILLDIMLPGISGADALRRLRDAGSTIPVLMLTARREVSTRVDALNAGADDYLQKPFNVEELIARVRALLRRSAANPEAKDG